MKKIVSATLITVLIIGTSTLSYGMEYTDVKSSNWAYEAVGAMSERNVITGYPDGSFKPNNTITYGEFIKMALNADTGEDVGNAEAGHWALEYYNQALELGYYTKYDIAKERLDWEIPRAYMALIISSILGDVQIKDYDEIQEGIEDITYKTNYEYDITKAYASGILTGYTDNTFKPDKTLSRAEATTVIYRLIDESKRILPHGEEQEDSNKPINEVITNLSSFYSENGVLDNYLAAAETYEFDANNTRYQMTLDENRGTKWIHFPASVESELGRRYLVKDNRVVEVLGLVPLSGGAVNAIYTADITAVDYIVSLDVSHHLLIIANPFKD